MKRNILFLTKSLLPQDLQRTYKVGFWVQISFVGDVVQALGTREGPIEGLNAHISNPFEHNILGNIVNNASFVH